MVLQCGKEKPSCTQCGEAGNSCYYPLAEAKGKAPAQKEGEEASEAEQRDEGEEPDDLPSPGFFLLLISFSELVGPTGDSPSTLGPSPADWTADNTRMPFPPSMTHEVSQQALPAASGLDFSDVNLRGLQRQPEAPAATQQSPSSQTRSGARRSLPDSQRQQTEPTYDAAASAWKTLPHAAPTSSSTNSISPSTTFASPSGRQTRSRASAGATTSDYQPAGEGSQQQASLSQAAILPPRQPSPAQLSPMHVPPSASRAGAGRGGRGRGRAAGPARAAAAAQS